MFQGLPTLTRQLVQQKIYPLKTSTFLLPWSNTEMERGQGKREVRKDWAVEETIADNGQAVGSVI